MNRHKRLPIPQKEFGFTVDTFNLIQEWTQDGERIVRERKQTEKARQRAAAAQAPLFQVNEKQT